MAFYTRKTPRAQRFDYTSGGAYFVTTCALDKVHYFGQVVDGKMILNEVGKICEQELHRMLQKRPTVDLHEYVIMPNHVHLLIVIAERRDTGLPCPEPESMDRTPQADVPTVSIMNMQSLWSIIGGWKSATSKSCHQLWYQFNRQPRFHDHIVRNEREYDAINQYIQNNPKKWSEDRFFTW